jgi:hypothetical protein
MATRPTPTRRRDVASLRSLARDLADAKLAMGRLATYAEEHPERASELRAIDAVLNLLALSCAPIIAQASYLRAMIRYVAPAEPEGQAFPVEPKATSGLLN